MITEVYTDDGRCLWAYHSPQKIAEAMGMEWRDLVDSFLDEDDGEE